jgi:hypothetical protein
MSNLPAAPFERGREGPTRCRSSSLTPPYDTADYSSDELSELGGMVGVQLREATSCVDTTPDLLGRRARSQSTSSLALICGRYT